jgi:hypothetical protein
MISWIYYDILGYHGINQETIAGRFFGVAAHE